MTHGTGYRCWPLTLGGAWHLAAALWSALPLAPATTLAFDLPRATHYTLVVRISPADRQLDGTAIVTIANPTARAVRDVPFLLYRLLTVSAASDAEGAPLRYRQSVVTMQGEPNWQVNSAVITLQEPLAPGDTTRIRLSYAGAVFGYPEVMAYTHDQVAQDYTLLRPDVLAYPILADPTPSSFLGYSKRFTYDLDVTVPRGLIVASGGLVRGRTSVDGTETFHFASRGPTWRIDVAAARFTVLTNTGGDVVVYSLIPDSARARTVLEEIDRVRTFYAGRFGTSPKARAYTVIEIPDDWGSQASDFYLLLAASAFRDSGGVGQIYHEIGHAWNAEARADVQRTRWFDEAFASYLEALALRRFRGEAAFQDRMASYRERFRGAVVADARNGDTPIAAYGREELGENSYTKGAWSLYVLNQIVGDDVFNQIIRIFLSDFATRPAGFKDFEAVATRVAGRKLTSFFQEWIYGAESSQLLVGDATIAEMAQRYH